MTVTLPPIRRHLVVPAPPAEAFRVFTERIGAWWPVAGFSVYGEKSSVAFQDGQLVETSPDGDRAVWGTVLQWEPPGLLRMTWHPGRDAEGTGQVEVSFVPVTDAQTLVTIKHEGWESMAGRTEYRGGWPTVGAAYAAQVTGTGGGDGPVYLVLRHTPAPGVADVFADPGFAGHPAFLGGLRERGLLVAAGPLPPAGAGMTIVRLDDPADAADVVRAAADEDLSVVDGVLEVEIRPWTVIMTGVGIG